jgi:hypothetical protein
LHSYFRQRGLYNESSISKMNSLVYFFIKFFNSNNTYYLLKVCDQCGQENNNVGGAEIFQCPSCFHTADRGILTLIYIYIYILFFPLFIFTLACFFIFYHLSFPFLFFIFPFPMFLLSIFFCFLLSYCLFFLLEFFNNPFF